MHLSRPTVRSEALKLSVRAHICDLSTQEAGVGGMGVEGQPGLHNVKKMSLKLLNGHGCDSAGACLALRAGVSLQHCINQVWRHTSVNPAFGRWRQENQKFKGLRPA